MNNDLFTVSYSSNIPQRDTFYLHSHNGYEIHYIIRGDLDFIVEGSVYKISPRDIIFVGPEEMHRALHKSSALYERVIIFIKDTFFTEFNCGELKEIFINRTLGTKNQVPFDDMTKNGIADVFERLQKYTNNYTNTKDHIFLSSILELLNLLNNKDVTKSATESRIHNVITYINDNFKEDITLSRISQKFFVSKEHLSRSFHQRTGYTVSEYVCLKRMAYIYNLCVSGETIGEACILAGFSDYSSFYRACKKLYGKNPRKWLNEKLS